MSSLPAPVARFLDAVEARDLDALLDCFVDGATYAYAMPMPALVGREAIGSMFGALFADASAARFEIVGFAVDGESVWTERVDRFTFGGRDVGIECMGVFELSGDRIRAVRDYVDMATWRERKGS
jgi:limonene-1,2-epoxide hydrolase